MVKKRSVINFSVIKIEVVILTLRLSGLYFKNELLAAMQMTILLERFFFLSVVVQYYIDLDRAALEIFAYKK